MNTQINKKSRLTFFCFHTRLSNEKINVTSESFTCVALEKMISWKTYWSSHYRFLQNSKRYSLIYPRCEAFSKKEKCFWQADSLKIKPRKCCLPCQKPILSRICFNFLCHTIATAHLSNGTKSHFWSELFHLWTDFKSWYAKMFGMMNVIIRSDF